MIKYYFILPLGGRSTVHMKTSTKNEYKCQVELKVELNADEMKEIVKDVERAFVREARLPGFRPGKVPIEIIRKQFADGLKQETEHTMIRKHYQDAVKAEKVALEGENLSTHTQESGGKAEGSNNESGDDAGLLCGGNVLGSQNGLDTCLSGAGAEEGSDEPGGEKAVYR